MAKRIDDTFENVNKPNQVFNIKRVSSLYDESIEIVGADDVQSPPSSASFSSRQQLELENNEPNKMNFQKKEIQSKKNCRWKKKDSKLLQNFKNFEKQNENDDDNNTNTIITTNNNNNNNNNDDDDDDDDDDDNDDDDDDGDEDEDEDDDDADVRAPMIQGAYDPSEFEELAVSEEIKDVFSYITKYIPQNIEIDNKLCPFLSDYIPAVGDIDAFIKIPRPDGKKDGLGLLVLDEPNLLQSDPAVLQLHLRVVNKQSSAKPMVVKKIENAEKNAKSIDRWIKAISDLHSSKPSPTMQYSRKMPNIDNLMQEWPPELEEKLNNTSIPNPQLDCDLPTYVNVICNLFDIPVYDSKIQSLHLFFTLYSTIKNTRQLLQSQSAA